jgi:hypothetical protein
MDDSTAKPESKKKKAIPAHPPTLLSGMFLLGCETSPATGMMRYGHIPPTVIRRAPPTAPKLKFT